MLASEINIEINCLSFAMGLALTPRISPLASTAWLHKSRYRRKKGGSTVGETHCQEGRKASCKFMLAPAYLGTQLRGKALPIGRVWLMAQTLGRAQGQPGVVASTGGWGFGFVFTKYFCFYERLPLHLITSVVKHMYGQRFEKCKITRLCVTENKVI